MKIKAVYIGADLRVNGKRWKITEGNESEYESAGLLFIFEPKSPKLKRNAKDKEITEQHTDSDSDRAADFDGTILAV
jgi:ribosomal protein L35